jgi:hypothetical protein
MRNGKKSLSCPLQPARTLVAEIVVTRTTSFARNVMFNILMSEPPNATVHRAAANDFDLTKPRGPRLRVQRFVLLAT